MRGNDPLLWAIIDRVRGEAAGDLETATSMFRAELEALEDNDLVAVDVSFSRCMQRAYDHNLWAAACVIHGGCGDDSFWDFRAGLIALGREVFEAALENPDSLATIEDIETLTLFEGFQYIPGEAVEDRGLARQSPGHSIGEPTGAGFDAQNAAALKAKFPKLAARFDWL